MMLLGVKLSDGTLSYESGSSRQRTHSAVSSTAKRGSSSGPSTKESRTAASICRRAGTRPGCWPSVLRGRAPAGAELGPAHPARSLLRGQPHPLRGLPGSPCLTGLSGVRHRLWKTLAPRVVRPGPRLESGAPAAGVDPAPRPTCPPAPRLPLLSACPPACGRKLW